MRYFPPFVETISDVPEYLTGVHKLSESITRLTAVSKKEKITILLADDDLDDCEFFEEAMGELEQKTKLNCVHDGAELLAYLKKEKSLKPDIIFLDINMPSIDGLECLKEIRKEKSMNDIPVVMFTTSTNPEHVITAYEKGANLFWSKPESHDELMSMTKKIFSLNWDLHPPKNGKANFVVE